MLQEAIFKKGKDRRLGDQMRAQNLKKRFEKKEEETEVIKGDTHAVTPEFKFEDDRHQKWGQLEDQEVKREERDERYYDENGSIEPNIGKIEIKNAFSEMTKGNSTVVDTFSKNFEHDDDGDDLDNVSEVDQLKRAAQVLMSQAQELISPQTKTVDSSQAPQINEPVPPPPVGDKNARGIETNSKLQREDFDKLIREFRQDLGTLSSAFDDDEMENTFDIKTARSEPKSEKVIESAKKVDKDVDDSEVAML